MMTCEEVRLSLGAHALGALDPEEALEIDNHLATCETCGSELTELEGVASFLGKVSERDVELVGSPPRQVLDRLLNDRAKRFRRGRMLLVAAASVAVLAVGGTVWTAVQSSRPGGTAAAAPEADTSQARSSAADSQAHASESQAHASESPTGASPFSDAQPRLAEPSREAPDRAQAVEGREFPGVNKAKGYRATVAAWPGDSGTELAISVTNMPAGTTCTLVVVDVDGHRDPTGSWFISGKGYQAKAVFKQTTPVLMGDIARFEIVAPSGELLVTVPVRKAK
ncbi:anti-sigma factor family protein [Nonomuraea jiangxiensis]|uniref:Transmembrane transcriptional regulator (Anti-sigma factor RsiW) n=1 Tax=Nonomuraea jiangxiensis TaxID=633440 RepID=A0A1G8LD03_9ACTN|nr:zf-HC2 domain-containing protein [Nonomuraea jiangxiensis]SDI53493.1 Transmembrane transcriptional regulator (anti-sigma factor RsiW) [Nonomuraea jiangxiensis]